MIERGKFGDICPGVCGRILALVLLTLALLNPGLPWGQAAVDLVLLLDDSASMPRSDSNRAWREVLTRARDLPPGSRFSLLRFAADDVMEFGPLAVGADEFDRYHQLPAPPRVRALQTSGTDFEQALGHAIDQRSPDRTQAIVIASDGRQTSGDAARGLADGDGPATPVLWWRPRSPSGTTKAWIQSLEAPQRAVSGQQIPVTVQLRAGASTPADFQLLVDGRPVLKQAVAIEAPETTVMHRNLAIQGTGDHLIQALVHTPGQAPSAAASLSRLVYVDGPARVLYVGEHTADSPAVRSLSAGGWPLTVSRPGAFDPAQLEGSDVLILDNIAYPLLNDETWQLIGNAVVRHGKGLILAGGPDTFGGGGYRRTQLEQLLPVTAESRRPTTPAKVLFLLDTSGSMERGKAAEGISRMAIARQAVAESARFLEPEDLSGLITFDVDTRVRLPLGQHDANDWRGQILDLSPRGGTRLAPALNRALDLLANGPDGQRLIVLVTDGFVEQDGEFSTLADRIRETGVDLVALAIGKKAETTLLKQLTDLNQGRLLAVDDIAYLPRLMRDELMRQRSAMVSGPITPQGTKDKGPFSGHDDWPVLDGYMVTRVRDQAQVHLVSEKQDPLLASHFAGNGRVVALPGGLHDWASNWHDWSDWGHFLGTLVEWTAGRLGGQRIQVGHQQQPGTILLSADLVSADNNWRQESEVLARISDPAGRTLSLPLRPVAPGHYRARLPASLPGSYRIQLQAGRDSARHALLYQPEEELSPPRGKPPTLDSMVKTGAFIPWDAADPWAKLKLEQNILETRASLILLALIAYLLTLAAERSLLPAGRRWRNG